MVCSQCGHLNADDAAFCSKCGAAQAAGAGQERTLAVDPSLSRPALPDDGTGFDEAAWRALIGPRVEYYLPRFRAQHDSGRRAHWHWPTFFVTFWWLLYRKMWLWAAGYYFVLPFLFAIVFVVVAVMTGGHNAAQVFGGLWLASFVIMMFVPPIYANAAYYVHCRSLIAKHRALGHSRERFLGQLEGRGGTSKVAVIFAAIFAFVPVIGILAAIALPAYQDYTKRAKSAQAIASGMVVARQVGSIFERTQHLPPSLDGLRQDSGSASSVADMRLDPQSGVIAIDIVFGGTARGGTVYLIPTTEAGGKVTWRCRPAPEIRKLVPMSCRSE
jgi:type II secretory pathway pseudopilin PulG